MSELTQARLLIRYEHTMERAGAHLLTLLHECEARGGPLPGLLRNDILATHAALVYPAAVYYAKLEAIIASGDRDLGRVA